MKLRAVPPPPPKPTREPRPPARTAEDTGARPLGPFRVGRYEVNARIASGGMATVHLGRVLGAAGFSRVVAIKRLLPQFTADPEFQAMFVEEAQLAARIRHPNVVPTLDVVASDGELLLVMEYVHGESLGRLTSSARVANGVPLSIALTIVCDTLHGLHAAHEAKDRLGRPLGLVHRDVSPQNVLVGVDGVARVIDFGIAKAVTSLNTTREGLVRGKVAYMAPEQILGGRLTRRTDLYAVGVMLWELLVGERLFPGGARPDLIQKVEGHIPHPKELVPNLPPALDAIVMRALATAERDRYTDALEMAGEIERTALLAPRSDVAPWVERLSSEALGKHAALLAQVESAGHSELPPPPNAPPPSVASHTTGLNPVAALERAERPAAASRPSLSPATAPAMPLAMALSASAGVPSPASRAPRVKRSLLFAAFGILVVASAGAVVALRSSADPTPPKPNDVVVTAKAAAAPTIEPRPVAPEPQAVTDESPPAPAVSASVAPTPAATARPSQRTAPRASERPSVTKGPVKTQGAKKANCNPPYVTDARGRRRYKAECF